MPLLGPNLYDLILHFDKYDQYMSIGLVKILT